MNDNHSLILLVYAPYINKIISGIPGYAKYRTVLIRRSKTDKISRNNFVEYMSRAFNNLISSPTQLINITVAKLW